MALPMATTAEFIFSLAHRNGVCKPQVGTWRGKAFQALVLLPWFVFGSAWLPPDPCSPLRASPFPAARGEVSAGRAEPGGTPAVNSCVTLLFELLLPYSR